MKLTVLASLLFLMPGLNIQSSENRQEESKMFKVIADFKSNNQAQGWFVTTDRVMGGISRGQFLQKTGHAEFNGVLSLDNNGGFVLTGNNGNWDFSGYDDFMIDVAGDEKIYTAYIKDQAAVRNGYSYQASFTAPKANAQGSPYSEIRLNLNSFKPLYRGRNLNIKALDLKNIREVGIMIKEKQEGAFELDIESFWIER